MFRANGRAANIGEYCTGYGLAPGAPATLRCVPCVGGAKKTRQARLSARHAGMAVYSAAFASLFNSKVEMQVIVVGSGKLAKELLGALPAHGEAQVLPWAGAGLRAEKSVALHAGSGRELEAVCAFCESTHSPLVELATGSGLEGRAVGFPVVLCPNTNILMLKFMAMLERSGPLFRGYRTGLTESHQAQKTSVPGTAVGMAQALGLAPGDIRSVRDAGVQRDVLQIPREHLARHAYHRVLIEDGACSVTLESRVYGDAPYAEGVAHIVAAVRARPLENRCYSIMEFIDNAWV